MSAFTELLEFVGKLPEYLQPEYRLLIDNYVSERDRLQNERIATSQASTGTFEVVAIAGTRETLLSDVTDTNVGEVNAGDTVYLSDTNIANKGDWQRMNEDEITENESYKVERKENWFGVPHLVFEGKQFMHPATHFRKVQTPLSNPHQTIEGC
jgi:hypothetical protein